MGVERLADGEGRGMLLPVARGHVVADQITEDMIVRVRFAYAFSRLSDNHAQLDFIIKFLRNAGIDVVIRTGYATGLFVEPELLPIGRSLCRGSVCPYV